MQAGERKALVVMTDVARRHFRDPAELTAGTGAVALLVSRHPRVLAVEEASGYACKEIYDVARPTATTEWGDAVLSLYAYLDLVELAWQHYKVAAGNDAPVTEQFRYVLYHTPLVSLAARAHQALIEADSFDATDDDVRESFDRMVRPALAYAVRLANTYSGSVYTLLAGLIDEGAAPADTRRTVFIRLGLGGRILRGASRRAGGLDACRARHSAAPRRSPRRLRRRVRVARHGERMRSDERRLRAVSRRPRRALPGCVSWPPAPRARTNRESLPHVCLELTSSACRSIRPATLSTFSARP